MTETALHMKFWKDLLETIDRRRAETGDSTLGSSIERGIMDRLFEELEHDILEDPGALEPWLVRRRD